MSGAAVADAVALLGGPDYDAGVLELVRAGPEVVDSLLPLLKSDDSNVVCWAGFTLGLIGERRSASAIVEAIGGAYRDEPLGEETPVGAMLMLALAELREPSLFDFFERVVRSCGSGRPDLEWLADLSQSPQRTLAASRSAAYATALMFSQSAAQDILTMGETKALLYGAAVVPRSPLHMYVAAALIGLGNLLDARAIPVLARAAKESDPFIQITAVKSLGRLARVGAAKAIVGSLKDRNWQVRNAAASVLRHGGANEVAYELTEALQDPSPSVRINSALALEGYATAHAVPALVGMLGSDEVQSRVAAVRCMAAMPDGVPLEHVLTALDDEDIEVRARGALAVATFGSDVASTAVEMTESGNWKYVSAGALLLQSAIPDRQQAALAIELLAHAAGREDLAWDAHYCLGACGHQAAVARKEALYSQANETNREALVLGAALCRSGETHAFLRRALGDPEPNVVRAAAESFVQFARAGDEDVLRKLLEPYVQDLKRRLKEEDKYYLLTDVSEAAQHAERALAAIATDDAVQALKEASAFSLSATTSLDRAWANRHVKSYGTDSTMPAESHTPPSSKSGCAGVFTLAAGLFSLGLVLSSFVYGSDLLRGFSNEREQEVMQ